MGSPRWERDVDSTGRSEFGPNLPSGGKREVGHWWDEQLCTEVETRCAKGKRNQITKGPICRISTINILRAL